MDSFLVLIIFIAFACLIYSSMYYYNKYTNLKKTEIPLYKLKDIFIHNPNMYPKFNPTNSITIDTFLSAINNPITIDTFLSAINNLTKPITIDTFLSAINNPTKSITIDTFLSAINNPADPFVSYT